MPESEIEPALHDQLERVAEGCTRCGACARQCAFLARHGLPGDMAASLIAENGEGAKGMQTAYECSLCGLCTVLCPENLDMRGMFLAIRRAYAASGALNLKDYATILGYERRGNSRLFSWYGIPNGCGTVFFPGCALPGTRPGGTWDMAGHLAKAIPDLGVVLACCNKPSHDLGRQAQFEARFGMIRDHLVKGGVRRVLTACPNCHAIFRQYGGPLEVATVWEHLDESGLPLPGGLEGAVTLHDPCPLRHEPEAHAAVRRILNAMGLEVREMRHRKKRTLCCGEGGSVPFIAPDLAKAWSERRVREAGGERIFTYCAGCEGFLGRLTGTAHLADLVFKPGLALSGKARAAKAPFTYLNRLLLKLRLKKWFASGKAGSLGAHPGLEPETQQVNPRTGPRKGP